MASIPDPERACGLDGSFFVEHPDFPGIKGSPDALEALSQLKDEALAAGFDLKACSGWRSFSYQASIVSAKLCGKRPILDENERVVDTSGMNTASKLSAALRFSALPGFSRHHFGTDFDIYAKNLIPEGGRLELTCREYEKGMYFYEFGRWLEGALSKRGFVRPFTGRGAIAPEPWHISYLSEAEQCLAVFSFTRAIRAIKESGLEWAPEAVDYAKKHFPYLFS